MDYNDLAYIAKQNQISISSLSKEMGLTRQGLHAAVVNKSLTQERIIRLCKILEISPNEFFGWAETNTLNVSGNFASHVSGDNTQNSNEAINALKDQLKEKDKQIDRLLKIIENNRIGK